MADVIASFETLLGAGKESNYLEFIEKEKEKDELSGIVGPEQDEKRIEESSDAAILFWSLIVVVALLFFWIFIIVVTQEDGLHIINSMRNRSLQLPTTK